MKKFSFFATVIIIMTFLSTIVGSTTVYALDVEKTINVVDNQDYIEYIEDEITQKNFNSSLYGNVAEKYQKIPKDYKLDNNVANLVEKVIAKGKRDSAVKAKYSIYLFDYNNNEKGNYICTQFENGGYAIFDANTLDIYERSPRAQNPYHNYKKYQCYYGGPSNYGYKQNGYNDIFSGKKLNKSDMKALEKNMTRVKENELRDKEELKELQAEYGDVGTKAYNDVGELHYLGEGTPTGELAFDLMRALYFILLDTTYYERGYWFYIDTVGYDSSYFYFFDDFSDVLFGSNAYSSCTMIAMGMMLQYYERLELEDTVPNNTNHWGELYRYKTRIGLPDVSDTITEMLHQNLIRLIYPNLTFSTNVNLSTSLSTARTAFGSYFSQNPGVTSASRTLRGSSRTALLDAAECIYEGNPVMLGIEGAYKLYNGSEFASGGTVGPHSVVAYAYSIKKYLLFWKKVDEFLVHFGWYDDYYSEVYISSSIVDSSLVLNY